METGGPKLSFPRMILRWAGYLRARGEGGLKLRKKDTRTFLQQVSLSSLFSGSGEPRNMTVRSAGFRYSFGDATQTAKSASEKRAIIIEGGLGSPRYDGRAGAPPILFERVFVAFHCSAVISRTKLISGCTSDGGCTKFP